ncbi:MAG: hypothetical protein QOF42_1066, partial [Gammaproteobacteria bacterium]|nr:hypothetical protein [Gammaproteobacteria bacterium]
SLVANILSPHFWHSDWGQGATQVYRRVLNACMGNSAHEASIGPYLHRNMRPNLCAAHS